jgi:hypothetical protein
VTASTKPSQRLQEENDQSPGLLPLTSSTPSISSKNRPATTKQRHTVRILNRASAPMNKDEEKGQESEPLTQQLTRRTVQKV